MSAITGLIARSDPPGRLSGTLLSEALEADLGAKTPAPAPFAIPGSSNFPISQLVVTDLVGPTSVGSVSGIEFGLGLQVEDNGDTTVKVKSEFQYIYTSVCLVAMNIGGSNEVYRVRTRIDLSQWDDSMITCSATSDGDGFTLTSEFYDEVGLAWTGLSSLMVFPASQSIDTDGGYSEGPWVALNPTGVAQGWSIVRVSISGDSTSDDIYGLHLIFRRKMYA